MQSMQVNSSARVAPVREPNAPQLSALAPALRESDLDFDPSDVMWALRLAKLENPSAEDDLSQNPGVAPLLSARGMPDEPDIANDGELMDFHRAVLEGVFDDQRLPALFEGRRYIVFHARRESSFAYFLIVKVDAERGIAYVWHQDQNANPHIKTMRVAELASLFQCNDPRNAVMIGPKRLPLLSSAADISLADGMAGDEPMAADFQGIADAWQSVLIEYPEGVARDIELVKIIEARDFNTRNWGSEVRNIAPVKDLIDRGELGVKFFSSHLAQRDYVAFLVNLDGVFTTYFITGINAASRHLKCRQTDVATSPEYEISARHLLKLLENGEMDSHRIILGPHVRFEKRLGPVHHEKQMDNLCGLHAINAAVGGPVVSKFQFDRYLLATERELIDEGFDEADFFRNRSRSQVFNRDVSPDNGIPLDFLSQFITKHVPEAERIEFEVRGFHTKREILDRLSLCETRAHALLMLAQGHYVAFRKQGEDWLMIDSLRAEPIRCSPVRHVKSQNGTLVPASVGLIGLKLTALGD
ncbi:MAG: Josephin [Pseudomonadota bacterium]|jgi:hypothetical protein